MTTTLLNERTWLSKPPNITTEFKEEVIKVLSSYASKYSGLVDVMGDDMLSYLYGSLVYWENLWSAKGRLRRRFRAVKIAEWFAFWSGFVSAGGKFPLKNVKVKLPDITSRCRHSANGNFFAVIPIGTMTMPIKNILNRTLACLEKNQNIGKIFLIFDGLKADASFSAKYSKLEIVLLPTRKGPAMARNLAIASGFSEDYSDVLLLDSDIILNPICLRNLISEYITEDAGLACPKIYSAGSTWFDYYHNLSGTLNGRYLTQSGKRNLLFGTSSCMFLSKSVFDSGIMFSHNFTLAAGEDIDICLQALFAGFRIAPLNVSNVLHWYGYINNETKDWESFLNRFERYGKGEYLLTIKHPYYHYLVGFSAERLNIFKK